jgi:hypothetical protein
MDVDDNDASYTLYRLWLEREGPQAGTKNHKRCRQCGEVKPIRDFQLPRHRLCKRCLTRGELSPAEQAARDQQRTREYAEARAQERAAAIARGADPWQPLPVRDDKQRVKNYHVEKARRKARAQPTKTPKHRDPIKLCVRCHFKKHVSQFDHPDDRICLACYDPRPLP